jgi:hypothetical protein
VKHKWVKRIWAYQERHNNGSYQGGIPRCVHRGAYIVDIPWWHIKRIIERGNQMGHNKVGTLQGTHKVFHEEVIPRVVHKGSPPAMVPHERFPRGFPQEGSSRFSTGESLVGLTQGFPQVQVPQWVTEGWSRRGLFPRSARQ